MKWLVTSKQKMGLSLFMGFLVAVGAWAYLEQAERKMKNQYTMTTVLQAKKYIKEGKNIEPHLVEEVPIPVAYLPPTALKTKSDLLNTKGEVLYTARVGLLKGEHISKSKLFEAGSLRSLAWTLSPGQTAVSIRLNPEQAVAGLVQPGDSINLYATFDEQPGISAVQSRLLLSRVLVLAMGNQVWDPSGVSMKKTTDATSSVESLIVTLAVTAEEAGGVALASDRGRLLLALTSPLESQISKMRPRKLTDLWCINIKILFSVCIVARIIRPPPTVVWLVLKS